MDPKDGVNVKIKVGYSNSRVSHSFEVNFSVVKEKDVNKLEKKKLTYRGDKSNQTYLLVKSAHLTGFILVAWTYTEGTALPYVGL